VSDDEREAIIMDAIDSSEARCDSYYVEADDPCDGLDGCEYCLRRAAKAVLRALDP
jgi:hypothetical protein